MSGVKERVALAFLRHGTAEPESFAVSDPARQLIDRGREEVARTADAFREAQLVVAAAFSSPYRRARETAEVFLSHVGASHVVCGDVPGFEEDERLVPDARVATTAAWVGELAQASLAGARARHAGVEAGRLVLLFAAHEPILSQLAGHLTGHRRRALERAELVVLAWDGRAWLERFALRA